MSGTLAAIETAIGAIGRAYASGPIVLGGMVLTGIEVPDRLRVGGRQALLVHRVIGGGRVVDALGNDPDRLELSGRFMGPDAQARAQTIERMRGAGVPVAFSGAGLSGMVWVAQFEYAYEAKGAICSYRLTLERAVDPPVVSGGLGALSTMIGGDAAQAVSGLTSAIGQISSMSFTAVGQLNTVVGQITPVASLLGAGGALASVTNGLSRAVALTQSGVDLSTVPRSVDSVVSGLAQAGSGLGATIGQAGANVEGIIPANAASVTALVQNAGILSASVDAGGLVNRAAANTAALGNAVYAGPLVSA